jgi:hypothetical protein
LEELLAESRDIRYRWNMLRSIKSLFFLGYFIILWIAIYNMILYFSDEIPKEYWIIFFLMSAGVATFAAYTLLLIMRLPLHYLVKREGYSLMPRKYAITDSGIYYYFRGAGYRHTAWKDVTRVWFVFGSRIVRIYTKNRIDLGPVFKRQREIMRQNQRDVFDILLWPSDMQLFMDKYREHLLD